MYLKSATAHGDAVCPLTGCAQPLVIVWSHAIPVVLSDTESSLRRMRDATTRSWRIECEEGHVVLLPEGADDYEQTSAADMRRLRRLLYSQLSRTP